MKIICINILVTLILVALLDLGSHILLALYPIMVSPLIGTKIESKDTIYNWRVDLPNYSHDKEHARIYYNEKLSKKHHYAPWIIWRSKPQHGKAINIDDNGARIHNNASGNGQTTQRVYFLGGSAIWGWGVWDQETIPALFGAITGLPTFNKGEEGYVSRQEVEYFINLLIQEEPIDTAIFYDGANDISVGCRAELNPGDHERVQVFGTKINPPPAITSFWHFVEKGFFSRTKELISRIYQKASTISDEDDMDKAFLCDTSEKRAEEVASLLLKNWEIAHDLASARNIKFYAILQPVSSVGSPKLDHLKEYLSSSLQKELAKQFRVVYPLIQKIIRERQYDWILDYSGILSRDDYLFIGAVHVSEKGNHIIAEQLYKDIIQKSEAKKFRRG